MNLLIITGMSGAGKTTSMKFMEDMGYFCIDNLPVTLIDKLVDFSYTMPSENTKMAVGIDIRNGSILNETKRVLENLKQKQVNYEILFLDAEDEVLVKRYKETRRNHPLADGERVEQGIRKERVRLEELKKQATYILDTSQLLTRELKMELEKIFIKNEKFQNLFVTILSFGFKYGIPSDSDIVMDVRFLPNPYYVEGLRAKTGNDEEIKQYVMQFEEAKLFIDKLEDMVKFLIPNYIKEGKNQLVISIGCTGGKHRSVTIANALYDFLQKKGHTVIKQHRDIEKDSKRGK